MAQRLIEVAKRPAHSKRNRGGAAKHPWPDAEVDESPFAHVTADIVARARDAQPFRLASRLADRSKDELHKSRFLGSTARLLVYKGEAEASVIEAPPPKASARADAIAARRQADEELHRLRNELEALKATLADRETALAQAVSDNERRQQENQVALSKAEQAGTAAESAPLTEPDAERREQSALKLAEALAQAEAARDESEGQIRRLHDELAALKATLSDRESALAQTASDQEQARESWQHESPAAEHALKAAEAARLAEAEAKWREQAAMSLAEVRAQAEAARDEADGEIRRLHNESAALRSTLADRESALAQAALDHEQARTGWQHESQAALSNAEQAWKAAEAARLAEAQAEWREQSAMSLAELRTEAETARDQAEREIQNLRDDAAGLRSTLADREAALARAALNHEQARTSWQHESQAALSNAELAWKTAEAARLAEAEAKWQENSARALAALRAEAEAAREAADGTIRGLQDQVSAAHATLAEREAALAQTALETERARDHGRQELESALAQAKAWQAEEAQRLAAAEARWRTQSANALAEATARYQTAEGMLTQLRMQSDRARSDAVGGSIRSGEPRATFGAKPITRESESAPIRLPTREARGHGTQDSQIVLQPHRALQEQDPRASRKRGVMRDIVVVALLAIVAIVAYPRIEPLIPEPWRSNIAALTGGMGPSPNVAAQGSAAVVSDVNLRVAPSTTAEIITTLPRGLKVATIERRGDWTLVQIEGNSPNTQPRRGWVYSSFLGDEPGAVEDDSDTTPSEDSE